jgi:hypothetical protein
VEGDSPHASSRVEDALFVFNGVCFGYLCLSATSSSSTTLYMNLFKTSGKEMQIYILFDTLRHLCASPWHVCVHAYLPKWFGMSLNVGLLQRAGLRPENGQFSGLQDNVLKQQVLRTGYEGMQAEN